ncbi:MAG TPA: ribose-phosphate diphosphokinase [Croceibacterium sp.]
MTCAVFAFSAEAGPAERLANALGAPLRAVNVRHFPDGESLVRVDHAPDTVLLYRSLDHPNDKLIELLLAVSALRANGAAKVVLVAPYLAYMRQDIAFQEGEAVSQRVVGGLLADHFDALLTLDPHLHRTHSLAAVMPGIEAVSISAAPLLAAALDGSDDPLLVGPDGEARQWVERIARPLDLEFVVGRKQRTGDRQVSVALPDAERALDRRVILVDDLISSGVTLASAARLLRKAGARSVEALATHCLTGKADLAALRRAGVSRVLATDSVASAVGTLPVADLLADEIRRRRWCQ